MGRAPGHVRLVSATRRMDAMKQSCSLTHTHCPCGLVLRRNEMAEMYFFNSIGIAAIGILYVLHAQPAASQERRGVIPHAPLLKTVVPDTANLEVAVYETEYAPGGINPRHLDPAAITF